MVQFRLMWKRHAVAKATQLWIAEEAAIAARLAEYNAFADHRIEAYWMEAA